MRREPAYQKFKRYTYPKRISRNYEQLFILARARVARAGARLTEIKRRIPQQKVYYPNNMIVILRLSQELEAEFELDQARENLKRLEKKHHGKT